VGMSLNGPEVFLIIARATCDDFGNLTRTEALNRAVTSYKARKASWTDCADTLADSTEASPALCREANAALPVAM